MPRKKEQMVDEDTQPTAAKDHDACGGEPKPDSKSFEISHSDKTIQCLRYKPSLKRPDLIFTHGAGGTLTANAMVNFAAGFAANKPLLYFQGSMNLKSRTKMFHAVIKHERWGVVLGGRSMGARAAVIAANEDMNVKALVLVSYPLKDQKGSVRDKILLELRDDVEVLFISGDRDAMCDLTQLEEVRKRMTAKSWVVVVRDADHGMNVKPKKATDAVGISTGRLASEWLDARDANLTEAIIGWDPETNTTSLVSWSSNASTGAATAGSDQPKISVPMSKTQKVPNGIAKSSNSKPQKPIKSKRNTEAVVPKKRKAKAEAVDDLPTERETRSKRRNRS